MHEREYVGPSEHKWIDSAQTGSPLQKTRPGRIAACVVEALQNHRKVLEGQEHCAVHWHAKGDLEHRRFGVPAPWKDDVPEVPGASHVEAECNKTRRVEEEAGNQSGPHD